MSAKKNGKANTLLLTVWIQLSCHNRTVSNWPGKAQKALLRINKAMKACVYEDRLKEFHKCYLTVQTQNENMKTTSK